MNRCLHLLCRLGAAFLLVMLLWGCTDDEIRPGWIASVNGEGISFQEAETRRMSLFARRTADGASPDGETLQKQYRYVVSRLVEESIICQFMRDKGFQLDPAVVEAEEARIREDYPEGAFSLMLLEEGLHEETWRLSLRKRLIVEQFINSELRPEISITPAEVQQYYAANTRDFIIPEQWHFLQISGLSREEVEAAQKDLVEGKDAASAQKEHLVSIHDISMAREQLPEAVQTALDGLEPGQGSATSALDGAFRNFVFLEKLPQRQLDAAAISQRVEQVLTEKKLRGIYAEWLNNNLGKNTIAIAPALFRPLPQGPRETGRSPVLKSPVIPDIPLAGEETGSNGP